VAWTLINVPLVLSTIQHNIFEERWFDWRNYEIAVSYLLAGQSPYDPTWTSGTPFLYSPLLAWLMVPIVPLGFAGSVALHVGALALLRDRWLIAAVAVSWPWWTDLTAGNLFGLVFVLGLLALRENRWAEYGYLVACLLMPRPLQMPLAAWLLWRRPYLRGPTVVIALGSLILVVGTGLAQEWAEFLVTATAPMYGMNSYSPTRSLGMLWLVIAAPFAAYSFWRGWIGLAGILVSPYLIPSYFLAFFWDWKRPSTAWRSRRGAGRNAPS
jgi:hypothetical protein